jgi:hypothetical protein
MSLKDTYERINRSSIPKEQPSILNPNPEYCTAIWAMGDWIPTQEYHDLMNHLNILNSYGILFTENGLSGGKLHLTLFQLRTFPVCVNTPPLKSESQVLKYLLTTHPTFNVKFHGVSKTRNGLFLCGYPEYDINILRDQIRKTCENIVEPHPQDICHSTLFRFHTKPTQEALQIIEDIVVAYRDTTLLTFVPRVWEYGFGTWTQLDSQRRIIDSWSANPRWICHRGLKNGPNKDLENRESEILARLLEGWDVEIDVWYIDGEWWLGHDNPAKRLSDTSILLHPHVWVHCKHLPALERCIQQEHIHCFTHDSDEATLTSKQYIWCYPGKILGKKSICVMPERHNFTIDDICTAEYVCSDFLPERFYKKI